jgi:cytidyltransferase-like protein
VAVTSRRDGIVLGRFQPLHLGHLEYLDAARRRCRRLFVGITNPDPETRVVHAADPARSLPENNPFTYLERLLMIEAALLEAGWERDSFCLVPAPINRPERLPAYLPRPDEARCLLTIYDAWGETKAAELAALGYEVEVLWRRSRAERFTSGAAIRAAMRAGERWQHLVPPAVAAYLTRDRADPFTTAAP